MNSYYNMDEYKLMNKSQMKERLDQYYWNRSNMTELKVLCDLYVEYFGDLDEDEVRDVKFKQGYANFDVDRNLATQNFEKLFCDPKLNEETRMFTQFNLSTLYPKNPIPIPKIIHLLYFGETEFYNYHFRCIKSVITNMPNHKIFIYNSKEPVNNPLWSEIKQYPQIEIKPIQVPEYFDGFKLTCFQYKADVVRLEVLYECGGIYLDLDMLIIKNFEELFESNKDFYISKECSDHNGLINAFIACKPKNEFIKIWLDNFKSGLRMNNWAYHIRDTNRLLLEKNPHFKIKYNIEIVDYHHFFPINFSYTEIFENKQHHNFNKTTYGIHLWETILHNILIDGTFLPGIEDKSLINNINEIIRPYSSTTTGKYCFIHSCYTYTYGTNVLNKLLISLNNVKDQFEKIFIVNIGDNLENDMLMFNNEKIQIINYSNNIALFETPTLNLIHTFCENMDENCEILYLHTKGITCQDNENVMDWIDMMKYFVIDQHDNCSKLLKSHDSVGCNYSAQPYKHFSGNFWWANSNYIKQKLTKIYSDKKHINEWWICSGNDVNSFNLHNSGINHYNTYYSKNNYFKTNVL